MLFNSFEFAIFFALLYSAYLMLNHRGQNLLLLVGSYAFYSAWDYRFLSLLLLSTVVDYFCGLGIHGSQTDKRRKVFLVCSLAVNLGVLGFFKYYGFFVESLEVLLGNFVSDVKMLRLNIVVPIGISFYTFQTLSYTIDIYRKQLVPTRNFLDFALFVAFFPQLVAGPIERAANLLPQVTKPRTVSLNDFYEGCFLILWGVYLKVFVADNIAVIVDDLFDPMREPNGATTLIACYAFGFQVFGDFGGYSAIAKGLGRCMGFELMDNFNIAFCATNPSGFWRNWHISLTTWLRDYVYIPLGGNRNGEIKTYRNLIATTLLSGLWHGPSWNYIFFGAYHGLLLICYRILKPTLDGVQIRRNSLLNRLWWTASAVFMFNLVAFGWPIFRGTSLDQTVTMWASLFSLDTFQLLPEYQHEIAVLVAIGVPFLIINFVKFYKNDLMYFFHASLPIRAAYYFYLLCCIRIFGVTGGNEFIYFRF